MSRKVRISSTPQRIRTGSKSQKIHTCSMPQEDPHLHDVPEDLLELDDAEDPQREDPHLLEIRTCTMCQKIRIRGSASRICSMSQKIRICSMDQKIRTCRMAQKSRTCPMARKSRIGSTPPKDPHLLDGAEDPRQPDAPEDPHLLDVPEDPLMHDVPEDPHLLDGADRCPRKKSTTEDTSMNTSTGSNFLAWANHPYDSTK